MATITKLALSGNGTGVPLPINTTATDALTTVHTCDTVSTTVDEIWIYAFNHATAARELTLLFGSTATLSELTFTIPITERPELIVEGLPLVGQTGPTPLVSAFVTASDSIVLMGYVHRINSA